MGGEGPEGAIAAAFGTDVAVSGLRPLSSGASRRSWRFEIAGTGGGRYVLQQEMTAADPDAPADLRPLSMPGQAALMEAAGRAGVPVAPVIASGESDGIGWLVCREMDGEALPPRLLRDPALAPALSRLSDECARALSALHSIDPASIDPAHLDPAGTGSAGTGSAGAGRARLVEQDRLAVYRRRLDDMGEGRPVLELAYRWLIEHRPEPRPPVVVHGDFRLGNLLVSPNGLEAVLDWELAHLGDPHEDVAWAMIRAWRFDRHRPPGVFPERDRWPAAYDRAAGPGRGLDPATLEWWQVAGTWCWAVISAMQARRHLDGWVRSLEHAVIGRRVCESEWDLLELLP